MTPDFMSLSPMGACAVSAKSNPKQIRIRMATLWNFVQRHSDLRKCDIQKHLGTEANHLICRLYYCQALIRSYLAQCLHNPRGPANLDDGTRRFVQSKMNRQVARRRIAHAA